MHIEIELSSSAVLNTIMSSYLEDEIMRWCDRWGVPKTSVRTAIINEAGHGEKDYCRCVIEMDKDSYYTLFLMTVKEQYHPGLALGDFPYRLVKDPA